MIKLHKQIFVFIGIFVLMFGIASGIILLQQSAIFRLSANPKVEVSNLWITNINSDSATIVWTTTTVTNGFVRWAQTGKEPDRVTFPNDSQNGKVHSVKLSTLSPATPYSFRISINGNDFKNGQNDWSFKTSREIKKQSGKATINGTVISEDGNLVSDAVILAKISGSSPLSTVSSEQGQWEIDLTDAKTQTLSSYVSIDSNTSIVEISVYSANYLPFSIKTTPTLAKDLSIVVTK